MTTDHIFLHTFQAVYLTIDSSFVQYLSSFLERCSRHEARCTQSRTSDTLQNLSRSCWDSITYFYRLQVTTLQHTVFIAELAGSYNLTRLQVLRVTSVYNHLLTPDAVVFFHELLLVYYLLFQEASIARFYDFYLTHHLTNDDFEVLVINLHTLQTVYVLNFVYDIFLYGSRTLDSQDVGRSDSTV